MSVLTYDKRGYTADKGKWSEPDIDEMSEDAAAAVHFLARQKGIDGRRLGLMGSSQGGWTAPWAALKARETGFLIERAGAALTEAETYIHERRQEWRADGIDGLDLDYAVAFLREALDLAEQDQPLTSVDLLAKPYLNLAWYRKAIGDGLPSKSWSNKWWTWARRNMSSTSIPAIRELNIPILWMLGERDEAVPLVSTRAALERAFAQSPGKDETISIIEGAPHNFIVAGKNGKPGLSPQFFGGMAEWMAARGISDRSCWKKGAPN